MDEMKGAFELEVIKLEEELRQAEMSVQVEALERFYADDIMVTAPIGCVVGKSQIRDEIRRARTARVEVYEKDDFQVRAFGETVVASFRLTVKGQHEGVNISQQFRLSDVWLRRGGEWQVVSRHTAIIAAPQAITVEGS